MWFTSSTPTLATPGIIKWLNWKHGSTGKQAARLKNCQGHTTAKMPFGKTIMTYCIFLYSDSEEKMSNSDKLKMVKVKVFICYIDEEYR